MYEDNVRYASPFTPPRQTVRMVMILTAIGTVIGMVGAGWTHLPIVESLTCEPAGLFRDWKLWTVLTWPFVATSPGGAFSPIDIIFYFVFSLWMFGVPVEHALGSRRFLWFFLTVAVATAVVTALLSLLNPHFGALPIATVWVMGDAIVLAWVLMNWNAPVRLMFMFPMLGKHLLILTLGVPVGFLLLGYTHVVVPIFVGQAIAYLFIVRPGPARLIENIKAQWLGWQMRRKARHLHVVSADLRPERRKDYLN